MGLLGVGSVDFSFTLRACAALALGALLGAACGQTADTSQANSTASGGTAGRATSTGGQSESTGGSTASGGSSVIVVPTAGGVVEIATGGRSSDSNGITPHPAKECNIPSASPWGGGLLLCGDGSYRRPQAASCNTEVPRAAPGATCHPGDECCLDSDCVATPFGFCSYGACLYGCVSDSDCASDSLCLCQDPIGRCTPTACHSDAECPADYPCTAVASMRGFYCQTPTDACVSNFDCSSGHCVGGQCVTLPG